MKQTHKPLRRAPWGSLLIATAAFAVLLLGPAGCVKKQGAGSNCRCLKKTPGQGGAGAVTPPKTTPGCKGACEYFVHCQSARWSDDDEQKELRGRCEQDCAKAKAAGPKSQEAIFFGGIRKCAVGKACVPFGKCMREVIAELRKMVSGGQPTEDPKAIYKVPLGTSAVKGPADAPVTLIMFADYECPFCSRGWNTAVQLMKAYPGKIRFAYKHYPLPSHPRGRVAAEWGVCLMKQKGVDAFWKFHELMFKHGDDLSDAALAKHIQAAGGDAAATKKCVTAGTHKALLAADLQLGAGIGVDGTPAFFLNGKKLSGAQPIDEFKKAYAEALKRAEAAIKSGVKPNHVYQHLIKNGATKPVFLKGAGAARPPQGPPELDPTVVFRVPVSRSDATKGPADALVTIVEFADFQCPACTVGGTRMMQLLKEFPKDVRLVYRHNPLPSHPDASLAAEASLAVRAQKGDAGFFAYHDKLYANQRDLSRPVLEKLAQELGVDMARFKKALDAHTFAAVVTRDRKFAEKMGVMGTPAFYVNGKILMGVPPYEQLKKRIQDEIAAAKLKLKGGVTRATVYASLQKEGKTAPVFAKPQ